MSSHRRLHRCTPAALLLVALSAACGSDDGNAPDASGPRGIDHDPATSSDAASDAANPHASADAAATGRDGEAGDAGPPLRDGASPPTDGPVDAAQVAEASAPPAGSPVFVAVGYAGLRVRSTDLGLTWSDAQELGGGGDDEFLLRGVTFGSGQFVATGFRILTSPDGKAWTTRSHPQRQWLGGVVFAEDTFVAVGGYGYSLYSSDGVEWREASGRGTAPARGLAFGAGEFVASTDNGTWYKSADGQGWSADSSGHAGSRVVFCGSAFQEPSRCALPVARHDARTVEGGGVYISIAEGGMAIERSVDGQQYTRVYQSPRALEAVAFGAVE